MASADGEIAQEFRFFRVYKDGRVQLFNLPVEKIPPFDDPVSGVRSKDVVISSDPPVSARLFLPKTATTHGCPKLSLLFYLHGGGFCMQFAFSSKHHNFVAAVVAEAECVTVSVEYGLFPDQPLPGCYEDSWAALQWIGVQQDPWIAQHADLDRVFIAGNSAGGTISHILASRIGSIGLPAFSSGSSRAALNRIRFLLESLSIPRRLGSWLLILKEDPSEVESENDIVSSSDGGGLKN